mgnify:FL=1
MWIAWWLIRGLFPEDKEKLLRLWEARSGSPEEARLRAELEGSVQQGAVAALITSFDAAIAQTGPVKSEPQAASVKQEPATGVPVVKNEPSE